MRLTETLSEIKLKETQKFINYEEMYQGINELLDKCNEKAIEDRKEIIQLEQKCNASQFSVQPFASPRKPTNNKTKSYKGFVEYQGKCRRADGHSYKEDHVFNLFNINIIVTTEEGCADYCTN